MLNVTPLQRNKATRAKGTSAALSLGSHGWPPSRMRDASLCSAHALAQPSSRGPMRSAGKLSRAHAACITTGTESGKTAGTRNGTNLFWYRMNDQEQQLVGENGTAETTNPRKSEGLRGW